MEALHRKIKTIKFDPFVFWLFWFWKFSTHRQTDRQTFGPIEATCRHIKNRCVNWKLQSGNYREGYLQWYQLPGMWNTCTRLRKIITSRKNSAIRFFFLFLHGEFNFNICPPLHHQMPSHAPYWRSNTPAIRHKSQWQVAWMRAFKNRGTRREIRYWTCS